MSGELDGLTDSEILELAEEHELIELYNDVKYYHGVRFTFDIVTRYISVIIPPTFARRIPLSEIARPVFGYYVKVYITMESERGYKVVYSRETILNACSSDVEEELIQSLPSIIEDNKTWIMHNAYIGNTIDVKTRLDNIIMGVLAPCIFKKK